MTTTNRVLNEVYPALGSLGVGLGSLYARDSIDAVYGFISQYPKVTDFLFKSRFSPITQEQYSEGWNAATTGIDYKQASYIIATGLVSKLIADKVVGFFSAAVKTDKDSYADKIKKCVVYTLGSIISGVATYYTATELLKVSKNPAIAFALLTPVVHALYKAVLIFLSTITAIKQSWTLHRFVGFGFGLQGNVNSLEANKKYYDYEIKNLNKQVKVLEIVSLDERVVQGEVGGKKEEIKGLTQKINDIDTEVNTIDGELSKNLEQVQKDSFVQQKTTLTKQKTELEKKQVVKEQELQQLKEHFTKEKEKIEKRVEELNTLQKANEVALNEASATLNDYKVKQGLVA